MNFTAIDFETANAKRSSACSIGMAKVRDGRVVDTYYRLLRPVPGEFDFVNMSIHGITPEAVAGAPTLLECWSDVVDFVGQDVLVAHNVSFEQSVINQFMALHRFPAPTFDYLCTLYMSRVAFPRRSGYRLPDVCKDFLGRDVNHHDALEDAVACAELGVYLLGQFPRQDIRELMSALYVTPQSQKSEWKSLSGIKSAKGEFDPNDPLFGKKVVITGVLTSMSREAAVRLLVDHGAVYVTGVSKNTDIVLVGDGGYLSPVDGGKSSKWLKAEELAAAGAPIRIVFEREFLQAFKL